MDQSSAANAILYQPQPSGITLIAINRPHRRNAVDPPTAKQLYSTFLAFEADDSQKICIFHSTNGTFCAGGDLQALSAEPTDGSSGSPTHDSSSSSQSSTRAGAAGPVSLTARTIAPMGPSRLIVRKPVIAAIAGYAVAGGLELSLIADMRIVEEDAIFGVFCRRFGVPLIDGGTVRLPAVVGFGRAMDLVLTGRAVDAREAEKIGLATRVVEKGKSLEVAMEVAQGLLKFPERCMMADRRSLYYATYEAKGFEDALRFEFEEGVKVIEGESKAGARRFAAGQGRGGKL